MEDNKKKKTIIFSVIAVVTLLVVVVGATYAYFSADTTGNTGNVDVNASTASKRDVFSTSGEPTISLNVTSDKMQYADKGTVAVSDSKTMTVSLEAGSGKATCTYYLTYIPDEAFVGSGLDNELTLEGTNGSKSFGPIDIKGSSNVKLGSFKITDEYETPSEVTSETWTLIGKFNNLDADQNNSVNKTFSGTVQATNVVCKNSLEEEESKIQILNDGDIDTVGTEVAIGDEHFYVISSDIDSVTMLAKYNLLVGSDYTFDGELITTHSSSDEGYNMQSENAKGMWCENLSTRTNCSSNSVVPFSSTGYWYTSENDLKQEYRVSSPTYVYDFNGNAYEVAYVYDENAEIYEYVNNYKEALNIEIEEARLISYEELVALGCSDSTGLRTCKTDLVSANNREWIYSTSFWSGSVRGDDSIWNLTFTGIFDYANYYDDEMFGIRPVITISKDLFE